MAILAPCFHGHFHPSQCGQLEQRGQNPTPKGLTFSPTNCVEKSLMISKTAARKPGQV